jgi:hypothetical protein
MAEKGEKGEEDMKEEKKEERKVERKEGRKEKREEKKEVKRRGRFFEVVSLILIIAVIILLLIVVQVPYITTDTISEKVPVENCTQIAIPFASNFRTGLNYDNALKIYSSDGEALYRYSELKGYLFANIRNIGEDKGVYCLNARAYLIENFDNGEDSLALFQSLVSEDSAKVQEIDNWNSNRYNFPLCTENPISPIDIKRISFWGPSLVSKDVKEQYNLDNVYILFTIIPPTKEQCTTGYIEKAKEQEVTKYCNAWKHVVGMC